MTEALSYAQNVAEAFIASYKERGEPLPAFLAELSEGTQGLIEGELLVSA